MAKQKKSAAAAAVPAKKKVEKIKGETPAAPLVDTDLAAQSAARRVVAGLTPASAGTAATLAGSASFKHLKESLNKPASAGLAGILDKTAGPGQKKQNLPFHGGKQTGRNQTFGADVNRSGVPRRTGGG